MEYAVIKLGLQIKGEETSFRSFSWNDLNRNDSVLSQLHSSAVSLYRGVTNEKANVDLAAEDYSVSLHYYDTDNDKIIIWTESDVRNALDEYSTRGGRIRILARVQEKEKKDDSSTESATTARATQTTTVKTKEKGTKTEEPNVVIAFADLLRIAVVAAEAAVTAASSKEQRMAARQVSKDHLKAAKYAAKDSFKAAKAATRDIFKQARNSVPSVVKAGTDTVAAVASIAINSQCPRDLKPAASMVKEPCVATTEAALAVSTDARPAVPELLFIHGGHGCDQCLTTPIVGKRFRATNIFDYDLCEVCYSNYKGSEIKFEEARLYRDVMFQERWNRKRAIQQALSSSSMPPHPPPPYHGHPPRCCPPHYPLMPAPYNHQASCGAEDAAFEEAIRRSIQEVAFQDKGTEDPDITDKPRTVVDNVIVKSADTFSDCKEAPEEELELTADKKAADEDRITESAVVETDEVIMTGSVDVETVKEEESERGEETVAKTESDAMKTVEEDKDEKAYSLKDNLSGSDAAGSGDIVALVGETPDRMGVAIEDLNNFNTVFSKSFRQKECGVEDNGDCGSKIMDADDDLVSEGSWSVVIEEEQIAVDEGLGRATELIGSALFNRDMCVSENVSALTRSIGGSSSSSISNVLSVTSVPTTVRSIDTTDVAQVQLERWTVQLEKLHELGFLNDALCVYVLESLAAANIGVESEGEVLVQQVVETLINGW